MLQTVPFTRPSLIGMVLRWMDHDSLGKASFDTGSGRSPRQLYDNYTTTIRQLYDNYIRQLYDNYVLLEVLLSTRILYKINTRLH